MNPGLCAEHCEAVLWLLIHVSYNTHTDPASILNIMKQLSKKGWASLDGQVRSIPVIVSILTL